MSNKPNPFKFLFSGPILIYLGFVVIFFAGWVVLPLFISAIPKFTVKEFIWIFSVLLIIFISLAVDRMITYDNLYGKDEEDATRDKSV